MSIVKVPLPAQHLQIKQYQFCKKVLAGAIEKDSLFIFIAEMDEDDDVDLFGSDDEEEDAAAAKLREERLAAYAAKKAAKAAAKA